MQCKEELSQNPNDLAIKLSVLREGELSVIGAVQTWSS